MGLNQYISYHSLMIIEEYWLYISHIFFKSKRFTVSKKVEINYYIETARAESLLHHPVVRYFIYIVRVGNIYPDALSLATGYPGEKHVGVSREMPSIVSNWKVCELFVEFLAALSSLSKRVTAWHASTIAEKARLSTLYRDDRLPICKA